MITFDSLTLKAWIKENTDFLTGARIQKIQQPTRKDFIFTLRNNSRTRKLYLNINPQFYHLCFMSGDNELKRDFEIPKQPPMFCMLLRKYLENSLICKVNQPPYERIFELYIETYNELSEKIYLCLAVELMGKHSNVILYNHDTNIILGCAHNVGPEKSRERELAGTFPYVYPPVLHKTDITLYNGELNYETLYKDFYWISKSFQKQCKNVSLNDLKKLVNAEDFSPAISKDYTEYTLFSNLIEKPILQNSVNDMLDNYYSFYMQKDKYNSLKRNIIGNINSQIKRNSATLKKMSEKLNAAKDNDKNRLYADLIMSALYNNSDYSDCINIYDYENGENIKIHLDKTLTLKENANKF